MSNQYETDQVTEQEVFDYIDLVRESGKINMFGVAPYIAEEFGINIRVARSLLTEWMKRFGK